VRGRVVDGLSGTPLPQLTVRFSPQPRRSYSPGIDPQPPNRTAITGADGTFEVPRLVAADYSIYADARGEYLTIQYGRNSANGHARLLEVGEDARLDITIKAWRGATIEGHVFDERGRPVVGAQVRVFADDPSLYGSASTDDRGAYQIARLHPGRYAVGVEVGLRNRTLSATPRRPSPYGFDMGGYVLDRALRTVLISYSAPFPPVDDDGRPRVYESAFAGGSATRAGATAFRLEAGDVRSNVDITLTAVRGTRIAGVVNAPGKVDGTILTLARAGDPPTVDGNIQATAAKDGTFVFIAVPPGQYTLTGFRREPPLTEVSLAGGFPSTAMDDMIGRDPDDVSLALPMSVGDADVDHLVLTLRSGTPVSGRIVIEDADPRETGLAGQPRLVLAPAQPPRNTFEDRYLPIGRDGRSASMRIRPGTYRILCQYGISSHTFKTAILNGVAIGDGPLVIGEQPIADLQFVFARMDTMLRGAIVDPSGKPRVRGTVLVFPADRERWFRLDESSHGRRIEVANGRYQAEGLPPGDYYAIALNSYQRSFSSSGLEALIGTATRVTLRSGAPQTLSLIVREDQK
jgi:hypothetical protein